MYKTEPNRSRYAVSKQKTMVFLDCETTGLDSVHNEIIEFCAFKFVVIGEKYFSVDSIYLRMHIENTQYVSRDAMRVNGYKEEDWRAAEKQEAGAKKIAQFLQGEQYIVGHNIGFDISFLRETFQRHRINCNFGRKQLDTQTLVHEHLFPCGLKSSSMDSVRKFLGWKIERYHNASMDALDVFRLYKLLNRANFIQRSFWKIQHKIRKAF